jgi:tripartite-type tricarboxylate transporter receptor subunit TctC
MTRMSTDIVARAVGEEPGRALGRTVVVDNRAVAGGTIATAREAAKWAEAAEQSGAQVD